MSRFTLMVLVGFAVWAPARAEDSAPSLLDAAGQAELKAFAESLPTKSLLGLGKEASAILLSASGVCAPGVMSIPTFAALDTLPITGYLSMAAAKLTAPKELKEIRDAIPEERKPEETVGHMYGGGLSGITSGLQYLVAGAMKFDAWMRDDSSRYPATMGQDVAKPAYAGTRAVTTALLGQNGSCRKAVLKSLMLSGYVRTKYGRQTTTTPEGATAAPTALGSPTAPAHTP